MSSILKALKKLEDENQARTPDSLRINAEILRGGDSPRFSTPGILLAALLLFLCGGVAMYLVLAPGGNRQVTAMPAATVAGAIHDTAAPVAPAVPASHSRPADMPGRNVIVQQEPDGKRSAALKPSPAATQKPARNKPQPRPPNKPPPNAAATPDPELPVVPARPAVRVNGIAYQDGSDSVAVINGVPVSRGALIEGVKVEEILRDRVQFMFGGEKFEVYLGKSNQ